MPKTTNPCAAVFEGTRCEATTEVLTYCRFHWRQQHRGAAFTAVKTRRARNLLMVRDDQGRKQCAKCSEWRDLSAYRPSSSTRDGLQSWCSPCSADYMSVNRYGLTRQDVDDMLAAQGGCAMCGTGEPRAAGYRNGWHVDHDHACCPTGRTCGKCVRAILCADCNLLIGQAGDSIERLEQAIAYLRDCEAKREHRT